MRFFGPSLPLGQNALVYYTSIKRDVKIVLHRWRLLRHFLFFKNLLTLEMLHFYLSLVKRKNFLKHVYLSILHISFIIVSLRNHDFDDIISFIYCPSMKWLPLLIFTSQYSGFAHWRSIGLTDDAWWYVTVLLGTWSYKNETIFFLPYRVSFRFYGTENL